MFSSSIKLRQHAIDDENIMHLRLCQRQSGLAVGRMIRDMASFLQGLHKEGRRLGIVFYKQYTHGFGV